jgi:Pyruvate/2-oxoacid:ferredoxin oxidoreductase delta subunit
MSKAILDMEKCLRCEKCEAVSACPAKAIFRLDGDTLIETKYCYGCGACIEACVGRAITMKL